MGDDKHIRFPCKQCGSHLLFSAGTASMKCEYCGAENDIVASTESIDELDFREQLAELAKAEEITESRKVNCESCGAEYDRPQNTVAFECPYCGTDMVVEAGSRKLIKPKSLLPFAITRDQGRSLFTKWIKGLWFAPNALKKYRRTPERLAGMYTPYWTYDTNATSNYTGQRGDDYWVTQTYTTTVNGKSVTRTRQVRQTRWTSVRGQVHNRFDDILVIASNSLPHKYAEKLEPWDLENLTPYRDEYLSGFQAESYQVGLEDGFVIAQQIMDNPIRASVRRDIGGDHQRIHSLHTRYDDVSFKHILLPVWISAYRFKGKVYRFLVNARTGEVQGERPWSWIKITLFVLFCVAVVGAAVHYLAPLIN